jgi:hypothetical protein
MARKGIAYNSIAMNSRIARLRTAWLGLFAMLMLVFAPLASQSLAVARAATQLAIEAELCTADATNDSAIHQEHHEHAGSDGLLNACGYCDLMFNHAAMPSVPAATLAPVVLALITTIPIPSQRYIALGAFPSGRPRAPPVLLLTV